MNFIIKYECRDRDGAIIKSGKMRVKNKSNSFEAKCGLEKYLKGKIENFYCLVVKECVEDNILNSLFGDIFGNDNPFK